MILKALKKKSNRSFGCKLNEIRTISLKLTEDIQEFLLKEAVDGRRSAPRLDETIKENF